MPKVGGSVAAGVGRVNVGFSPRKLGKLAETGEISDMALSARYHAGT
jgi:hypothetical protein